jgi:hypothetical protein
MRQSGFYSDETPDENLLEEEAIEQTKVDLGTKLLSSIIKNTEVDDPKHDSPQFIVRHFFVIPPVLVATILETMATIDTGLCPFLLFSKFINLYDEALETFPDEPHLPASLKICMNWIVSWAGLGLNRAMNKTQTKQCLPNQAVAFVLDQFPTEIALLSEQVAIKIMDEVED